MLSRVGSGANGWVFWVGRYPMYPVLLQGYFWLTREFLGV